VNAAKQSSPRAASSISTARPVNIAAPKPKVNNALPTTYSYFKAHSLVRRTFNQKSAAKTNNFNEKANTARVNNVTTTGPKAVVSVADGNGENAVKSSACWIWRPTGTGNPQYTLQDQGIFNSRCSRHMIGNKSFLTDYQEIDGGFVAFRGSPKGGKITGKDKIRTGKLDFEDTECLVLSLDTKLLDESQVLLKVPRHDNMYNFDLKNVVPLGEGKATQSLLFSWVFFLATKDETSGILKTFITGIENQINHKVKIIRCDNGTEFKNNDMNQLCGMKGIKREFSVARTPQQNGVAKRKNRTLIEAARTMLADSLLPTTFWAEAVNTACYVQNRVLVTKPHNKTPYELLHGRPPSISFMRPFGCPVTILNTLDPLGKFDGKADEGFFVGYSINSKAFRVFNTRTRKVEENLHITFLENKPNVAGSGPDWLFDIDLLTNSMNYEPVTAGNQTNRNAGIKDNVDAVPTQQYILLPLLYDSPQSLEDAVADDAGKKTNEKPANEGERNGQEKEGGASNKEVSTVSPSVSAAGQSFDNADDLSTNHLMPDLEDTTDLLNTGIFSGVYDDEDEGAEADLNNLETTMNVFRNKKDERGIIVRNKARLVAQGYTQKEGIYYDEVFTLVARIEAIGLFLAYASFMGFIVYQIDMKSAFLYGTIEEEMSSIRELSFFFGLQVKQKDDGIFISQDKYVADILKKFDFATVKTTRTPTETNKALLKDEEAKDVDVQLYRSMIGSLMYLTTSRPDIMFVVCACARDLPFDLEAFSDSDYAGASLDKKSTTEGCQFLSKRLISCQCKKQTIVANSTTEAEYIAAANCCGQVLWI
ncbi:putative ribonuclease H-like domain-containing protein, partial [Tanacetum coccineum]